MGQSVQSAGPGRVWREPGAEDAAGRFFPGKRKKLSWPTFRSALRKVRFSPPRKSTLHSAKPRARSFPWLMSIVCCIGIAGASWVPGLVRSSPTVNAKRNSKKLPQLLQEALAGRPPGVPVRLLFEDEVRFERLSDPRRCWAPWPQRPSVGQQVIREFVYGLVAVSPQDGQLASQGDGGFARAVALALPVSIWFIPSEAQIAPPCGQRTHAPFPL